MLIVLALFFSFALVFVIGGNGNLKGVADGLPVSSTHVSSGALFGLAAGNGRGKLKTLFTILLSWISTLPLAAVLAYTAAKLLTFPGGN